MRGPCERGQHPCHTVCPWMQNKPAKPTVLPFWKISLPWWSSEWVEDTSMVTVESGTDWFGVTITTETQRFDHWVMAGSSLGQSCLAHAWDSAPSGSGPPGLAPIPWNPLPAVLCSPSIRSGISNFCVYCDVKQMGNAALKVTLPVPNVSLSFFFPQMSL